MKNFLNRFKVIALTLFGIFLGLPSFAQGDKTGGGGDIIFCREKNKMVASLLDLYEAKKFGHSPQLGPDSLTLREKVKIAHDSFAATDPYRADRLTQEVNEMLEDIRALDKKLPAPHGLVEFTDGELADIDDESEPFQDKNCTKFQMVTQTLITDPNNALNSETGEFQNTAHYLIHRPRFKSLNRDHQIATLFHEVIFREFRSSGALLSREARALNARIITGSMGDFTQIGYLDYLRRNQIQYYRVHPLLKIMLFRDLPQLSIDSKGNIDHWTVEKIITLGDLEFTLTDLQFNQRRLSDAAIKNVTGPADFDLTSKSRLLFGYGYYTLTDVGTEDSIRGVSINLDPHGKINFLDKHLK